MPKTVEKLKVYIRPFFTEADNGEGGIRRVVEAQYKYLPLFGIEPVETMDEADLAVYHGGVWEDTKLPVVSHCHGLYWQDYEWSQWAHSLNGMVINAMRRADVVTAPSKWVSRIIQRGALLDAPVLYHGVDTDEWKPLADDAARSINIPYVLWNKTRVDQICTPDPVHILAEASPKTMFVSTFATKTPTPNIKLTGKLPLPEAKTYIEEAAVYLCTTRETFGIGTIEAMACGVPILGWRWGGQAEFVEHRVHGYLATPYDYDDLLKGLEFCLENKERLGKAARELVCSQFTWHKTMERYAACYRTLLRDISRQRQAPKVSIVVTCYNLADSLGRAVESVNTQESWSGDHEIIIVNDASPDNTQEVAEKLAASDKRIRIVKNSSNLYLAGSLNAGIAAARGHYIVPLDADNELGPRALKVLSNALDLDRGIDIAYGAMQVIDETGSNQPFISGWPKDFNFAEQMRHRNQIPSTSMYRRKVWERVGGYRRRCRTAEDADFWCRATSFGAIPRRITDAVTLIYHDRSDSMSHTEPDWDWTAWYPWSRDLRLTPFIAAQYKSIIVGVPTYEPPLVTVIIPVGPGHAQYVVDAIDSLIAQTYQNWRVIVVNDSGEKLSKLPPFVRVLTVGSGEAGKLGPSRARNLAIARCETPLFIPLDADDYLHPDALKIMLDAWRTRDIAAGGDKEYYYSDWFVQETNEVKKMQDFDPELLRGQLIHSVTAMYPTEAWKSTGGFDEELEAWEDWDFVLALIEKGYCGVHIPQPLFYYRMNSGKRREDLYARRETLKPVMANKWKKWLIEGADMACGCSNTRNLAPIPAYVPSDSNGSSNGAASLMAPAAGFTLMEFVADAPKRVYRGPKSGVEYIFGNVDGHKMKYVRDEDISLFANRIEFRKVDTSTVATTMSNVVLEAAGPPQREAVPA